MDHVEHHRQEVDLGRNMEIRATDIFVSPQGVYDLLPSPANLCRWGLIADQVLLSPFIKPEQNTNIKSAWIPCCAANETHAHTMTGREYIFTRVCFQ
ncbi:hypothetical protein DPMN_187508 [Dreissena polymorpha]|uniref:Uncharacterized protein n=1 Tax=Dreissena polymorpha TaxID=45954 RepID=A0A9D4DNG7_DREPO|nr:hypothetical protein DPMN_187508 [Dreissena polymorpha]